MQPDRRLFAVVPAAGRSRRMGRPKLLLPLGNTTIIARLLDVLNRADIAERLVVVRPDDEPLRAAVCAAGATAVRPPVAPPDMRNSVEYALAEIQRRHSPSADDGWLLTPADHPMLEPKVLGVLIDCWFRDDCRILVPTFNRRRGHPAIFRWELAGEVASLPSGQGLNRLLQTHQQDVVEVAVNDPAVVTDLDTPADYEALLGRFTDG